jgi:hypothetical protein
MIREEVEKEAEVFFEWPSDDRSVVSFVSCKLFVEHMLDKMASERAKARLATLDTSRKVDIAEL